jgi:hypothetical protein
MGDSYSRCVKIPLVWNAPTCDRCGHPAVDIFQAEGRVLLSCWLLENDVHLSRVTAGLQKNIDDSVDISFGPTSPASRKFENKYEMQHCELMQEQNEYIVGSHDTTAITDYSYRE